MSWSRDLFLMQSMLVLVMGVVCWVKKPSNVLEAPKRSDRVKRNMMDKTMRGLTFINGFTLIASHGMQLVTLVLTETKKIATSVHNVFFDDQNTNLNEDTQILVPDKYQNANMSQKLVAKTREDAVWTFVKTNWLSLVFFFAFFNLILLLFLKFRRSSEVVEQKLVAVLKQHQLRDHKHKLNGKSRTKKKQLRKRGF